MLELSDVLVGRGGGGVGAETTGGGTCGVFGGSGMEGGLQEFDEDVATEERFDDVLKSMIYPENFHIFLILVHRVL